MFNTLGVRLSLIMINSFFFVFFFFLGGINCVIILILLLLGCVFCGLLIKFCFWTYQQEYMAFVEATTASN